jgi:hypothetical protein
MRQKRAGLYQNSGICASKGMAWLMSRENDCQTKIRFIPTLELAPDIVIVAVYNQI